MPDDYAACRTCSGTGVEHSGVCHCGEYMDADGPFAHSGHCKTEMSRPCPDCSSPVADHEGHPVYPDDLLDCAEGCHEP